VEGPTDGGQAAPRWIIRPARAEDLADVRTMLADYAAWVGQDLSFQGFQEEVAGLPGDYAPPAGAVLVVSSSPERGGAPLMGVIALRRRDDSTCEMKRLYVRPAARGLGLGRALVERLLAHARGAGYRAIVLDTLPIMSDAHGLYERLGFRDIPPYYDTPIAGTRFMGRAL
jgi:ribosomal protein S18 acetylase RimI-like enzyme